MNQEHELQKHYCHSDGVMLKICWGLFAYSLALAAWYNTWMEALTIGGGSAVVLTLIRILSPGTIISRIAISSGMMVFTALHIHQAQGMIEMHFGVFALLAVLLYYRDPIPIIVAAALIAVHHLSFFYLQSAGTPVWVLKTTDSGIWIILLHAAYVVVETSLLVWFAICRKNDAEQSIEIKQATKLITQDKNIDLTVRTSGKTELLERFNNYTNDIEKLTREVKSKAASVSGDGISLGEIVEQIQSVTCSQQQETEELSQSISDMQSAIKSVTGDAESAATATHEVDIHAREATHVSEGIREEVERLASGISEAQETIQELNNHTNSIGSVLEVIRGVAEQTNLLALNAAIEAARAGEQGRGFAVVADEVRTLAQRTQKSTQEIDELIENLQSGSEKAVQVISSSQKQAENCVKNTSASLSLMQQVSSAIQSINRTNDSIASCALEQNSVVDTISQKITNIRDASDHAKHISERAAASSANLKQISTELIDLTNAYKISEK